VHTDDDVVEFGPLIGLATEIFESFNGVFRYCSILSNHLAPSRDIARQLADQEGLKHRLAGGWWPCGEDGKWERAGSGVRHFMAEHPILQKLLGWTEPSSMKHGTVSSHLKMFTAESSFTGDFKLVPLKRAEGARKSYPLESTSAAKAVNYGMYTPESMWSKCSYVISESLDECLVGSWVFATSPTAAVSHPSN
jgi:hypothetical protein